MSLALALSLVGVALIDAALIVGPEPLHAILAINGVAALFFAFFRWAADV